MFVFTNFRSNFVHGSVVTNDEDHGIAETFPSGRNEGGGQGGNFKPGLPDGPKFLHEACPGLLCLTLALRVVVEEDGTGILPL